MTGKEATRLLREIAALLQMRGRCATWFLVGDDAAVCARPKGTCDIGQHGGTGS